MSRPCHDTHETIVDFTLGILSEEQVRDMQSHLDTCESCRQYMRELTEQSEALTALGQQVQADMDARQEKVLEALEYVTPTGPKVVPFVNGFVRTAVAAVLVLSVGIFIGRLTSPKPVNVEQLRADLQSSIVASLQPAVRQSVLADVDERLESALTTRDERVAAEVVEQVRQDLRLVATDLMAGSERLVDRRFAEVVQLIEAARQTDRRQVATALDQIKTQTGMGFLKLAMLSEGMPVTRQSQ
jgi:anti-sigma factor RsiW